MKKRIFIVAGLAYGDESKGSIVDWLSLVYPVKEIWRYNGGPQTAHNVVLEDGVNHCFAQFGSGLLQAPISTVLSRFVAVNPINLMNEYEVLEAKLKFPMPPIYLDSKAPIITPYHVLVNQLKELNLGLDRRGSCGKGVGETLKDAEKYPDRILRVGDLADVDLIKAKLRFWRSLKLDEAEQLANAKTSCLAWFNHSKIKSHEYFDFLVNFYSSFLEQDKIIPFDSRHPFMDIKESSDGDIVYEGAQGLLLHRDYGFFPHVTQSDTSFKNAETLIAERGLQGEVFKLGVLRAYSTRHGAGPFVSEDEELGELIPDDHNCENGWQGDFRIGWFDIVSTKYALDVVSSIDGLAITNLDRLQELDEVKVCTAYEYDGLYSHLLEKYFVCEENQSDRTWLIKSIKKRQENDSSDFMEEIKRFLGSCEPVYETIQVGPDFSEKYLRYLEKSLEVPIVIVSNGPTAADKKVVGKLL